MNRTAVVGIGSEARSGSPAEAPVSQPTRPVLLVQGVYYLLTGVWPLVSIDTFQMVTGPKTDLWLVKTVGALIAVIAVTLLAAARRLTFPIILLALASAAVLTAVDVIYVVQGVIPPVYLLDAAAEVVLIAWWAVALFLQNRGAFRP